MAAKGSPVQAILAPFNISPLPYSAFILIPSCCHAFKLVNFWFLMIITVFVIMLVRAYVYDYYFVVMMS